MKYFKYNETRVTCNNLIFQYTTRLLDKFYTDKSINLEIIIIQYYVKFFWDIGRVLWLMINIGIEKEYTSVSPLFYYYLLLLVYLHLCSQMDFGLASHVPPLFLVFSQ